MEPKYTAQNILAGWDELQERNKKRRRLPTIVNELYSLSDPNFRSSGAYLRNKKYIEGLGGAEFADYSRRMKLLAEAEQSELDSLFMGRMADTDIPNVEAFDDWVAQQGSYVQGKRDKFFTSWDKRMDTIREQSQYAEEANIDTVVGAMMAQYYDRMATTTDPVEQNSIILEANKAVTELASKYPSESGKIRSTVNERLRKIVGDTTGVRNATQKASEREEAIEDRNRATIDRALKTGRTITRNRLVQEVIDRVSKGEDYEVVKNEVMGRANDMYSDDYLQDKDMLSSLRAGIEFAKEDKKPSAFQYVAEMEKSLIQMFDPNDPSQDARGDWKENARNVASMIATEERTRGDANPVFYNYTKKQRKGIVIENILDTYLRVNPEAFNIDVIKGQFANWVGGFEEGSPPNKTQIDGVITELARQIGMPFEVAEYILFPKRFVIGAK